MYKFLLQISTVLALVALCACDWKVEPGFDVADQKSKNVYSPTCTTSGVAKEVFWNFNNCTACGFNCHVKGGENVYNNIATTLASELVDPVITTTFSLNGIEVTRSTSVMTARFSADQPYALETVAYVPRVAFHGVYKVTFEVTPKGQPDNKVACASCEFRTV